MSEKVELKRYRNDTDVDQIIYYRGKRHVLVAGRKSDRKFAGTIQLPESEARKYGRILKLVK